MGTVRFAVTFTAVAFAMQAGAESISPNKSELETDMVVIRGFAIDRHEVSIERFSRFASATSFISAAEAAGGGSTFEGGWQKRDGWTWRTPFGKAGLPREPATHLNFSEAQRFCQWGGKRLPTDAEWALAAYTETRNKPTNNFITGRSYPYPTGDSPVGANCVGDCGRVKTIQNAQTSIGSGHAEVGTTAQGVNGLFEMGGNVWEWVDSGPGNEKRTRGGSWWYGASQMRSDYVQTKPADTAVIYIGFRCAKSL